MRIIKEGDLNRIKKYKKFECDKCGCEFVADHNEYSDCSNQHDGPVFKYIGVCPTCGNNNIYNYSYSICKFKEN